jgi:hypothetical protein
MIRSVLAVLAGYLTMVLGVTAFFAAVLTIAYGGMPEPSAFRPPAWLLLAELLSGVLLAATGGYVCAFIARRREMAHAYALVAVVLLLGVASAVVDHGTKPLWASLALPVLAAVAALAGARLRLAHART